jgi:hypothetical protein
MVSKQRRAVTTSEVQAGLTVAVTVRYLEATKQMVVSDRPASDSAIADAKESSHPTAQPVQGKSYHCRREAGDKGQLLVTDERGIVPPTTEYEIVAQNMETIGRANPLAEFLAGRSVAVGETLKLPRDAADRMFNLSEQFGDVTCFDLTLRKTLTVDGAQCPTRRRCGCKSRGRWWCNSKRAGRYRRIFPALSGSRNHAAVTALPIK